MSQNSVEMEDVEALHLAEDELQAVVVDDNAQLEVFVKVVSLIFKK